jgi:predicted transcriptional regulator
MAPENKAQSMSTTLLKLPDELKQRAIDAAQALGISPHAFMVDAIRQAVYAVEQRAAFIVQARDARAEMLAEGQGHATDDVRTYLRSRLTDPAAARPAKTPWRK